MNRGRTADPNEDRVDATAPDEECLWASPSMIDCPTRDVP
jgi:hypothetical protein